MAAPFGFSIGDVIAVSILIKDVFNALDSATGSVSEHQELCRELWALDRSLLEVEMLSRTCDTSIELNALSHTVRRVVDQCRECIEAFLAKLKGYERSLGDEKGCGSRISDVRRKIKWGLTQKDELVRFRTTINGHSSAINMMLIVANINLTKVTGKNFVSQFEDAQRKNDERDGQQQIALGAIQDKLDEHGRRLESQGTNYGRLIESFGYIVKLGTDLKTLAWNIWTLNFKTYDAVVDLQSRIPKEFGPCWIQEPFILTDALGRVAPIHIELINSWDVFENVLKARFVDLPGEGKVARGEYAVHEPNMERDIERWQPFATCFPPGHRLDMMMVFKEDVGHLSRNSCPVCSATSRENSLSAARCKNCGTWFQRMTELDQAPQPLANQDRQTHMGVEGKNNTSSSRKQHSKGKGKRTNFEEDDMRAFKRLRLLHTRPIIPTPVDRDGWDRRETSKDEREAWLEKEQKERRRKRRSTWSVQKRSLAQGIGSDTDDEDLQHPFEGVAPSDANVTGCSIRRVRRKIAGPILNCPPIEMSTEAWETDRSEELAEEAEGGDKERWTMELPFHGRWI